MRSAVLLCLSLQLASVAHADERAPAVEMATYGALYGLGVGVLTSVETDVNLRPAAWITAATTAGGLFGGLEVAERLELSTGQVRMTGSIATWAMIDTVLLAAWTDWLDEGTPWAMMGAGALGGGAGLLLAQQGVDPRPGDLGLINSGGIWLVPAGLLFGFTFHLGSGDNLPRNVLLLSKLGLGTGMLLAHRYDPSHEQVLYLDLGLLAGAVGGGLLGVIVAAYSDQPEPATALALLGMGVGAWIAIDAVGFDGGARDAAPASAGAALTVPLLGGVW